MTKTTTKPKKKSAPPPPEPSAHGWARIPIAIGMLGAGALMIVGRTDTARYVAIAFALLIPIVTAMTVREHRRVTRAELAAGIAAITHTDPSRAIVRRARRWRQGAPTIGWAPYGGTFDDAEGTRARAHLDELLHRRVDPDLTIAYDTRRRRVSWRPRREGDALITTGAPAGVGADVDPTDALEAKVVAELRPLLKGDALVDATIDDRGPAAIVVRYPEGVRDDDDAMRTAVQGVINAKVPGRWRATWSTEKNRVLFERRPPMPADIPHPSPKDVPTLGVGPYLSIPIGMDEFGEIVRWDWKLAPHCLIAGETNSGKTVIIRTIALRLAEAGVQVFACDPKRTELSPLRGWPNVETVASSTEDMIALVEDIYALMETRYSEDEAAIAAGLPRPTFRAAALIIDEAREWIDRVNAGWRANRGPGRTGMEHPVVEMWRSLGRLGRTANIHLVVGIQRPDAKQFGGEARDNYGFRVAAAAMKAEGARMMFGSAAVGTDVPSDAPGRGTVQLGVKAAREVQFYWTPDVHLATGKDAAILERLRPPAARVVPPAVRRPSKVQDTVVVQVLDGNDLPSREDVTPDRLNRGDRVLWDGDWHTVLAVDPDEDSEDSEDGYAVEWRGPDGTVAVQVWDGNDLLSRERIQD